MSPKTTEN